MTKEEIQKNTHGDVYTIDEFLNLTDDGVIIPYDGNGYFHDGEKETRISVWNEEITYDEVIAKYPYIVWYNR